MNGESEEPNAATLRSYEAGAARYVQAHYAPSPELLAFVDAFAGMLPGSGAVLEIGSATGEDADRLEARGLRVHRTDATRAFVMRLQAQGVPAAVFNVITDELEGPWDGIYANAVFLHFDIPDLTAVLRKLGQASTPEGVLGFTVKEGDGAGWTTEKLDRPRYFRYWREPALRALLDASPWDLIDLRRVTGPRDDWLQCLRRPRAQR